MTRLSDYPYDPTAKVEELHGLDKLRAVEERSWAEVLFRLWFQLRPDTPSAEEWDPGEYDPDDVHDPSGSNAEEQDRIDAALHHCWQAFYSSMRDYEQEHGRRLTRRQRENHEHRYANQLEAAYGRRLPRATWVSRFKEWTGASEPVVAPPQRKQRW